MANITFENILAQIAAGTITAQGILQYPCSSLSAMEKQALLIALAQKEVEDGTPLTMAAVLSGIQDVAGDIVVPNFLAGSFQLIDTDATAQNDLGGTHQFATDTLGGSFPENSVTTFTAVPGSYYPGRTITVPAGITAIYSFVLTP